MSETREAPSSRTDLLKVWLPVVLIVVAGFAWAWASLDPPPPSAFSMATGSPEGAYHAFALRYRDILAGQGYELEVVETAGSDENLRLLADGEVDLALVQGGALTAAVDGQSESLASLFFEPVWVFYRGELEVTRLADLEGRRVAVGPPGSGARTLALRLLTASGLDAENCQLLELGSVAAAQALADGTADAAFFVASIQASFIEPMLRDEQLELLSFQRHRAYSHRFPFLSRVILGQGVFDLEDDLPARDVSLLAAAASLVARHDLHEGLIPLLLEMMREVHGPGLIFEPPGEFPSTRYVELPLQAEARHYLEQGPSFLHRFLSFRMATGLDRAKILLLPLVTLLIPLFKMAPPLYRWRIRSRIYRWYEDLRQVDTSVETEPSGEELMRQVAELCRLEKEVTDEVSVPLSYMDEYYRLREHIRLVSQKLEKLRE